MYSCFAEFRKASQDLSRRRPKLANSRLVQGVMALVAGAQGCRLNPCMSNSFDSSSLAPSTTYYNVSVLTD